MLNFWRLFRGPHFIGTVQATPAELRGPYPHAVFNRRARHVQIGGLA